MTGLLVSVRSAAEARAALSGGADLIDVKEPSRGALGAADPAVWHEVAAEVAGAAPLSAALGELASGELANPQLLGGEFQYAKLGLAGCAEMADWPSRWGGALDGFPRPLASVAVAYADWRAARSPRPREIVDYAGRLGCRVLLVDTYDKSHGDLLRHLPVEELSGLLGAVRSAGLKAVVAGSLSFATIPAVLCLSPDYVAVRGAVCRGARTTCVDESLVRALAALIGSTSRRDCPQFA